MTQPTDRPVHVQVGVLADQAGPLPFVGLANPNAANMVGPHINAKGGLLGRRAREKGILSPPFIRETTMLLATTTVANFDQFMKVFSNAGAEKRKQHGSQGALVFRDPNQADRVWAIFDWDEAGWKNFVSDPEVPPVLKNAGHTSKPQSLPLVAQCEA